MKLIDYLRRQNLTDEQFAALVGRSRWAVRKWMYGQRTPRLSEMQAIARVTDGAVSANDFMGESENSTARTECPKASRQSALRAFSVKV